MDCVFDARGSDTSDSSDSELWTWDSQSARPSLHYNRTRLVRESLLPIDISGEIGSVPICFIGILARIRCLRLLNK